MKISITNFYKSHHQLINWLIVAVLVTATWSLLYDQITGWARSLNDNFALTVRIQKPTAILSLNPQVKTLKTGDDFTADIILDTGGKEVDGVDVYSLHYDPSLLKVVDDDNSKPGTQISPGILMTQNAANMVDAQTGQIKFSQVAYGKGFFVGRGVLATVHFKALNAGTAYLNFDFTYGSTVDSNASFLGKDRLSSVVDGIYTIGAK